MIQRNGIVIRNGRQRFNRALFGYYQSRDFHWGNHRFKVLAGELPLFLLEDGYDRGKLRFHTTNSPLENLSGMEMRHYRNEVSYTWDDLPLLLAVTPLKDASGAMVWLHASAPICLQAEFGYASGKAFRLGGSSPHHNDPALYLMDEASRQTNVFTLTDGVFCLDDGSAREPVEGRCSCAPFYLKDGTVRCDISLSGGEDAWLLFTLGPCDAPNKDMWTALRAQWHEEAAKFLLDTPSETLDLGASLASILTEAMWHKPIYSHGAWSWELPFTGWRSVYGPICRGDHKNAITQFRDAANRQIKEGKHAGWICDRPENQNIDYDMGSVLAHELLYEYRWNGTEAFAREFFPFLRSFAACQKRLFDSDNDFLYDARINFWASDAIYYNGGGTLIGSAYNYALNRGLADMARRIGEDPAPFDREADSIYRAVHEKLYMPDRGYFAEYISTYGKKDVLYPSLSMMGVLHAAECGLFSPGELEKCIRYLERDMEHLPSEIPGGEMLMPTNWVPYTWSTREPDFADEFHYALTLFAAGHWERAARLLESAVSITLNNPVSPGSFYCEYAFRNVEFGDTISMYGRALVEGLWGVQPDLPHGRVIVEPRIPEGWEQASLDIPDLSIRYEHRNGRCRVQAENRLGGTLVIRTPAGDFASDTAEWEFALPALPDVTLPPRIQPPSKQTVPAGRSESVPFAPNMDADDLFRRTYESPRPQCCTLQTPPHLHPSDWVNPEDLGPVADMHIQVGNTIRAEGVTYCLQGSRALAVSAWDNDPDHAEIPLSGHAKALCLLITGYTCHMMMEAEHFRLTVCYADGGEETLSLIPPYNFQSMYFYTAVNAEYVCRSITHHETKLPKQAKREIDAFAYKDCVIEDVSLGADFHGQSLCIPLDETRPLARLKLESRINDAVLCLMAITKII